MTRAPTVVVLACLVVGCAGHVARNEVQQRTENIEHRRLAAPEDGGNAQVGAYALGAGEGYRMPQLYAAPDPVVGSRDPRRELAPTTVCLQVVVDAQGRVERSLPLADRADCAAGNAPENAALLQAAQEAVAQWRYAPAAVCHFAAGRVPADRGDCTGAARIEAVPVSLLYAFTFEIVQGRHVVHRQQ